jgi:tetratricopeptide (TPR) repeat protein
MLPEPLRLIRQKMERRLEETQKLVATLKQLEEGWQTSADKANLLYELGNELNSVGEEKIALSVFDQVLEINPMHSDAWNARGLALFILERYEEAIGSFDRAIQINQNDSYAWSNRGEALYFLWRYEEAIDSFDRSLDIDPDDDDTWRIRGQALCALECYEGAIVCCNQVIRLYPNDSYARYDKSRYSALQGNIPQAIESLQQAIKLKPKHRRDARTDRDFNEIWEDRRFQQLIQGGGKRRKLIVYYQPSSANQPRELGIAYLFG